MRVEVRPNLQVVVTLESVEELINLVDATVQGQLGIDHCTKCERMSDEDLELALAGRVKLSELAGLLKDALRTLPRAGTRNLRGV